MVEKKLAYSTRAKRDLVEPENENLSIRHQCELLGLNRSSYYYQAAGESALNLELMRAIDEQYPEPRFTVGRK